MKNKIKEKIELYDKYLTEEVFRIYGRTNLTTAMLLAYCSPLRFYFQGQLLSRGWLDIVIFGDSRCGKSKIAESICRGLQLGELFSCENASFAGLIGGLQQVGSRTKWDIVWGKLPLNTGKLLIADEMSNLKIDDIASMSSVRSSGIAEIAKVQSGMTKAQTRMIWLSNPRDGSKMSEYTYGMIALKALIGRMEDIARFDFAIAVNTTDVPPEITNAFHDTSSNKSEEFGWEPLRHLVRWVWNLHPMEVIFSDDSTKKVLELACIQAKDYTASIPLVEPNEQRIKLARVSAAVAARCFSEDEYRLVVKPEHVEYADMFMRSCFNARALGYNTLSNSEKQDENENNEAIGSVKYVLKKYSSMSTRPLKLIHNMDILNIMDIGNIYNITAAEAREVLSVLMRCGCLTRTSHGGYRKTSFGIRVMEDMMNESI